MSSKTSEPFQTIAGVKATSKGQSNDDFKHVQDFLQRFGYLAEGEYKPGELDGPTSEALVKYQGFYKLRRTGTFNKPTRDKMTTARCGLPDMASGVAFATICSWDRFELTFAFETGTNDIAGNAEFQAVRNAFQTWASVVPFTFTEVALNKNPDIVIAWRPANDPDSNMEGRTLAHADYPPDCSVTVNALPLPLHFDDSEHTWSIGAAARAYDVETVALHEVGHLLGLLHSQVAGSVMVSTIGSNTTARQLTQDDIQGIQSLYMRPWQHIGHANHVVAMAAINNKLFCATRDNRLSWRDPIGSNVNWEHIGHANHVVAMAAINNKLFCATSDNRLWWRDPVGTNVNWQHIGHANHVVAMAAINNKLFCATSDNRLWWRDPVGTNVNWQHIGHANHVVAMAAINNKLFCATRDNRLWWRDPVGTNVNWQHIGHANHVVAMAAINNKLFCATRDNRLWWRDP